MSVSQGICCGIFIWNTFQRSRGRKADAVLCWQLRIFDRYIMWPNIYKVCEQRSLYGVAVRFPFTGTQMYPDLNYILGLLKY